MLDCIFGVRQPHLQFFETTVSVFEAPELAGLHCSLNALRLHFSEATVVTFEAPDSAGLSCSLDASCLHFFQATVSNSDAPDSAGPICSFTALCLHFCEAASIGFEAPELAGLVCIHNADFAGGIRHALLSGGALLTGRHHHILGRPQAAPISNKLWSCRRAELL